MKQNCNLMIKKIIIFTLSVVFSLSLISFSGCFLFKKPNTDVTVTINYYDDKETVVFNTAEKAKLNPIYTQGKVLIGFYDTQDDSGEMYFDYLGKSVKNDYWSSSYPHTLYAVYEDIDTSRVYTSYIHNNEEPELIYGYVYGYRTVCKFYNFSESGMSLKKSDNQLTANDKYFAAFIKSNANYKIRLTMHFLGKEKGNQAGKQFQYQIKIGEETFGDNVCTIPADWKEFSSSIEIVAKQLAIKQGEIYLLAVPDGYTANSGILIKNVYFELSLINS
ncbi:MAG: hypothetical protein ACI4MS_05790 [Candidatus Coproplasma sp.]